MKKFEISVKHNHSSDNLDHMKIALIQETEESSDGSSPKIFDVELSQHQNSKPLVLTFMKVK